MTTWLLIEVDNPRDAGKNELDRINVHFVEMGKSRIPPIKITGYGTRVHPATKE